MKYTAFDFLCIDVANQGHNDKILFEERIQWVKENFNRLPYLETSKKERPLYIKAVNALYAACRGEEIGHMVGLDATCSGMSLMSVWTKCYKGCWATNLIDPNLRNDAYTLVTDAASRHLGGGLIIERKDAKNATMTALYGSQKTPRDIFGKDTPELDAFYAGLWEIAPGAVELLGDLRNAWQPFALEHSWILPDCFEAKIKVMRKIEGERVEVDELDGSTFTYDYYVNEGVEKDLKLVANVTHSGDAFLVREMDRRCNYNAQEVKDCLSVLQREQQNRASGLHVEWTLGSAGTLAEHLIVRWFACEVPTARLFSCLNSLRVRFMADKHIQQMIDLASHMLSYKPFPIVTVHDEFKCHANNCNEMKGNYTRIMADIARGMMLEDIYEQITGHVPHYENAMDGDALAELILQSNYSLS